MEVIRCTHWTQVKIICKQERWMHWCDCHFRTCAERTYTRGYVDIGINENGIILGDNYEETEIINFEFSKYFKEALNAKD